MTKHAWKKTPGEALVLLSTQCETEPYLEEDPGKVEDHRVTKVRQLLIDKET